MDKMFHFFKTRAGGFDASSRLFQRWSNSGFRPPKSNERQSRMRATGTALLKTVNPSKALRHRSGLHGPTTSSLRLLEPAFLFLSCYCSLCSPPFFFWFRMPSTTTTGRPDEFHCTVKNSLRLNEPEAFDKLLLL
jgi:hypothetical protein